MKFIDAIQEQFANEYVGCMISHGGEQFIVEDVDVFQDMDGVWISFADINWVLCDKKYQDWRLKYGDVPITEELQKMWNIGEVHRITIRGTGELPVILSECN